MAVVCIRGAITVVRDDKELIYEATEEMMKDIISKNNINIEDIISIVFTATRDLTKAYPAVAVRGMGITRAALMCLQEMYVDGSLERCIRVMVLAEGNYNQGKLSHAYIREAEKLRPDLKK